MTVSDQLAIYFRLAQRELEQPRRAMHTAPARARHAVKGVGHAPHSAIKPRPRLLFPGIAMTTADADAAPGKVFDGIECSRKFRRECDSFDHVHMLEQGRH